MTKNKIVIPSPSYITINYKELMGKENKLWNELLMNDFNPIPLGSKKEKLVLGIDLNLIDNLNDEKFNELLSIILKYTRIIELTFNNVS